ncbi:hypothetical protein HaloA020_25970 [Halomonas sp. A020]|uniref:hypothetical protein n=1 Tax=Halomonas sp. A020 TaxID=2717374 RepID=UPI00249080B6|nr:hypothetical protein [Halomonas sp. A020]BCB61896.1 hypothetical protein HaloA020_25970 [Halomonas sp. A020]
MEFLDQSFWQGVAATLVGGALIALLTPVKNKIVDYRNRRKLKKYEQKLNMLKWEKEHIEKVKKSSVALSRAVYFDIFFLLLFLGLGLGLPVVGPVAANMNPFFEPIVTLLLPMSVPIWAVSLAIAIQNIKKFRNLDNYAAAIEKMNIKIDGVGQKIEKLSSNE